MAGTIDTSARQRPRPGGTGRLLATAAERTASATVDTRRDPDDDAVPTDAGGPSVTVRLFDADRPDATLELADALGRDLGERQLLWIDIEGRPDDGILDALADRLDLKPRTRRRLRETTNDPHISFHESYLHIRVATHADHDPSDSPRWLDMLAAERVALTMHAESITFLHHLDERIESDAKIGIIDGAAFVATAADAAVTTYFQAVDAIEEDVDRLDTRALDPRPGTDILSELVRLRRRIARLRRELADQREVFAAFGTPDFAAVAPTDDVASFQAVAARFGDAMTEVESSRDLLLGSFDIFMTRTSQRTNDVMKVLALATVLLLPGSLIAGLLGMNIVVPLPKDDPTAFWLVLGAIAALAVVVLVFARVRRWI